MEEQNANQAKLSHYGHFGLSDSVSAVVVDYYDLLFDNVQEFISHNKEDLKEYEQENSELAAKLAAGGLDQSGEQAIRNAMRTNAERIGEIQDFLNGDRARKAGIDFSEDILDDVEPELTDRFTAAPITEKYACLVKRYMEDYRTDLETRVDLSHKGYIEASAEVDSHRRDQPSVLDALTSFGSAGRQWVERLGALEHTAAGKWKDWQDLQTYAGTDSLVDIDAFRFGVKKTQDCFPKIAEQYSEHKRVEYKEALR